MGTVQRDTSEVKQAAANPQLEFLERLGYVVRGVLYAVMGFLALRIALAQPGGKATDLSGSLLWLIGNPFGKLVLIVTIIGLAAYSLWGFVRAIFDPLHRGRDTEGIAARVGFITSAVSYAAIAFFALQILAGQGGASNDSTQKTVSTLLTNPAGGVITVVLGLFSLMNTPPRTGRPRWPITRTAARRNWRSSSSRSGVVVYFPSPHSMHF